MNLKHKTFTAVRWTTAATGIRTLIQLAQVSILARLLLPTDYGLMAIVSVVLAFAGIFSDGGLNSAYVQRQNVSNEERSSLFWLNIFTSCSLTALLIILSPLFAIWFQDPRLSFILMLSATTFIIGALGQQIRMNAEKRLDFKVLMIAESTAALIGLIVAISTASYGLGVYSLVWGGLSNTASSSTLAWIFLAKGWRPQWHFCLADLRGYLGFGVSLMSNNLVNEINRNIDLLLGGRMLSSAALGLYSLPRQFVFQIQGAVNPIVTRVGFPLIAQVQSDIPAVRAIYLKTLNLTSSINAPIYISIAFFAPEIIYILLGEQWISATQILRLLAIWGLFRSIGNPVGSLLLGMGRADLSLKWNLMLLLVVPPLLWITSKNGTLGIAWGLLGFSCVIFVPTWYVLVRPLCHAKFREYCVAALRPPLLALTSIIPAFWIMGQFDGPLPRLMIASLVASPLYLIVSYTFNRDWTTSMYELIKSGRS